MRSHEEPNDDGGGGSSSRVGPQYAYAQSRCPDELMRYAAAAVAAETSSYRRLTTAVADYDGYDYDDDRYGGNGHRYQHHDHHRRRRYATMKVALPLIVIFFCLYAVLYDYVDIRHDSIAGWSSDTSRDTRTYVLPDNVTLLNQPKSICDLDESNNNIRSDSKEIEIEDGDSEIFLLVIICSKMENFDARAAIRSTWGNQVSYERLAKAFRNVSHHFENVNVTEKLLAEYGDFSNYTSMDKRYRRDLSYNEIVSLHDLDDILVNFTDSNNSNVTDEVTIPSLYSILINDSISVDESHPQSKRISKREIGEKDETNEIPDDPRFDRGSLKAVTEEVSVDDDDNILGNFEEGATDKQFDYYDYASEPSNIMRIPPKGGKYDIDEAVLKSVAEAKNLVKLALDKNIEERSKPPSTAPSERKRHKFNFDDLDSETTEKSDKLKRNIRTRFLFLLGQSSNENNTELQSKIDDEASVHDDIIQEGFVDSYNNLTLKSVMLLKWVVSNCGKNVRYIMKTDDDMYVNIPRLVDALQNKSKEFVMKSISKKGESLAETEIRYNHIPKARKNSILKDEKLLMGDLICEARPISDTSSKWYSPKYMYPGAVYPHYLSGTGYVMSFGTAKALYKAALNTPLFHLEDIFITGMCSKTAGVKPVDHPGFSYAVRKFDPCTFAYLITAHQVRPAQIRQMHDALARSPPQLLELCEVRRILANRTSSLIRTVMSKLSGPILGSPRSLINGLKGLGQAGGKSAHGKRRRPNNSCF